LLVSRWTSISRRTSGAGTER